MGGVAWARTVIRKEPGTKQTEGREHSSGGCALRQLEAARATPRKIPTLPGCPDPTPKEWLSVGDGGTPSVCSHLRVLF